MSISSAFHIFTLCRPYCHQYAIAIGKFIGVIALAVTRIALIRDGGGHAVAEGAICIIIVRIVVTVVTWQVRGNALGSLATQRPRSP